MSDIRIPDLIDPKKPIILYGAGGLTRMALNIWPQDLPKPIAIVDKNCSEKNQNIFEVPVFDLSFLIKKPKDAQLILSAFKANIFDITKDLNRLNITISATVYDVLNTYIPDKFSNGWGLTYDKFEFQTEIQNISTLFSDKKSKDILRDTFLWRANRIIKNDIYDRIEDESEKYINQITLPYIRNASIVIDGGSFDGKSSKQFADFTKENCQFLLYEPDKTSFQQLQKNHFQKFKPDIFNLALTNEINKKPFFATGGLSSRIVNNITDSNYQVKTTTIDQEMLKISTEFKNKAVIKLHIEGEEFNALLGASNLMLEHRPTWIINCSHNIEQLLETPKYLSLNGYKKIFLRCHSLFGEGLTLYALP